MQNAVAAHTFRKRPANCEANASLRWSWSIRPANHGVRFGYVAVDGGYGKDPAFLRGLETRSLCFLADVHKHQRIWLDDPAPYRPATTSRGRPASIRRTDRPALTVAEWAAQQPVSAWKRIKLRQGEKGTLKAEYLHARVWAWDRKEENRTPLASAGAPGMWCRHAFALWCSPTPMRAPRYPVLARMHGCRFHGYIRGLFQASRGSLLRMSEVVDTDSQALHHLLTEAGVDWDGLSGEVARQADALLGDEQAALILDESAFAKKGTASAGVARMWNGRLGKVDNSQVGVFSALCRDQRVTLLDTRLYLPKDWVEDAERCRRAHIPEEARQLRSKCELALELVDSARQHGVRFGYVAVDGGYGKDPAFLRGLETRSLCFLADVHKHQRIWLDDPAPYRPATTSRGRPASIRRTDRPALTVAEWAAQQPVSAWKRIKLRQGEKGTLKAEYLHARVWAWDRKEETARHWHLLVRRECGADTPSHFVFSNADASTSLSRLARMHGCRFFIEHAFREAKSELAMADYQVRRWDAWHRHMALVMVAMLFLLKERLALQAEAPMLSLADLVMAINQLLPRPEPTPNRIASIIHERHRRRQDALAACLRRESEI